MKTDRIVFWQPTPSPHQSSYLRSLANLLPLTNVVGVFEHSIPEPRRDLGWSLPNFGRIQLVLAPDKEQILQLLRESPESTMHVLSGLRSPMIREVFAMVAPTQSVIGVLSEGRDRRGVLGYIRRLHSLFLEDGYRNRVDFVLAMGNLGVHWFENCGYNKDRIFHWGYFVEPIGSTDSLATGDSDKVNLAYVGQLIPRKGVDILLRALAQVNRSNWKLQVVGRGKSAVSLRQLSTQLGIDKRVTYIDALPNSLVREIFRKVDFFVLPSRFDGWGAVVNEALMAGTPVVCTDHCGAATLVESSGYGKVAKAESVESLSDSLRAMIDLGPLPLTARNAIRDWARCIGGERAAEFFLEIIRYCEKGGEKPVAPWLRSNGPVDFTQNSFPANLKAIQKSNSSTKTPFS